MLSGTGQLAAVFVISARHTLGLSAQNLTASIRIQAIAEFLVETIQVVVATFLVFPPLRADSTVQNELRVGRHNV
jgi:hypothetical protein